jgi:hypothetical protein
MAFVHSDSLALPAVLLEPEKASGAVLMVGGGGRADFAAEALSALSAGKRVLIVDITGCGEIGKSRHVFYSAKDTPEEGAALMLYMLGESMVGRRATDVLAASDWLGRRSGGKVELFAKGSAAIGAAHQGSCVWETKPGDTTPVNDTIEIPWSIGGYVVAKPTAVSGLVYDGANKVGITPSVDASRYTIVGNTATNAGSYTAQATLNDPANCQWAGEALGVATIDISWSIARQPVPQISISTQNETVSPFAVISIRPQPSSLVWKIGS